MMRMICDGCLARVPSVTNDLTGRENQATTVQLTPADVIHLCPERCSTIYYENKDEVRKLQSETVQRYHERNDELKEKLWEMFKNAKREDESNPD